VDAFPFVLFGVFTPARCLWRAIGARSFMRRAAAIARWPMLKGRWLLVSFFFIFITMFPCRNLISKSTRG
jgi:hypothetical protein